MKKIITVFLLLLLAICSVAQTTGSFQETITFPQADYNFTRILHFYVPTDYDPARAYPLVVGFRGGPHTNAGQFRDQLTFLADSLGAIVLCPENYGHFWNQEGLTKKLFQYSVDTTSAMYNIDPELIYLTGLSYGGRHAVIVSMDTDEGSIPNLRGVIPFAPGLESQFRPDYENIDEFAPVCICIGLNDGSDFRSVASALQTDITAAGGSSLLNEIPGVGHTVAFPSYPEEMMECIRFIESQYETTGFGQAPEISKTAIDLSPNPARDYIDVSYSERVIPNDFLLLDHTGKVLGEIAPQQKRIDISGLSGGMHLLVIRTETQRIIKRFVIMR